MSDTYYGRVETPVDKVCRELRELQREHEAICKFLEAVQSSKEQNQKVYPTREDREDNYRFVTISKRYLLTRIRADKAAIEKKLKATQASYSAMERIAKRSPK